MEDGTRGTRLLDVDFNKAGYSAVAPHSTVMLSGSAPGVITVDCGGTYSADRHEMRVHLTTRGARSSLARQQVELREGMRLHVYDADADDTGNRDDLAGEAVAHFDHELGHWVALVDVKTIKNVSELAGEPSHWANSVNWAEVHAAEREDPGPVAAAQSPGGHT